MKKVFFLVPLFFFGTIFPQREISMNQIQDIVNNYKIEYAPDKRTALFNIEVEGNEGNWILNGETNLKNAEEKLIEELKAKNIKFQNNIDVLPSKSLGDKVYAIIDVSSSSMRTHPKHAAEMATQALLGCYVEVFKKSESWYLVQTPDKYISWVEGSNITRMNESEAAAWQNADKVIYTNDYGFSFDAPEEDANHVSDLVVGNLLKKLGTENNFVKVGYPDGRIAYIPETSCQDYGKWLKDRKLNSDNIIKAAKQFMGIPYLWGGTSAKALDCSGFTRTVFFLNGVYLPRDASQQVHVGNPVDTKNGFDKLEPGDLLFFGTKATDSTKEKVTHVGIYIGNDEFIHESGKVQINSFNKNAENFSSYRLHQFLRAKRVLNSVGKNGVVSLENVKY